MSGAPDAAAVLRGSRRLHVLGQQLEPTQPAGTAASSTLGGSQPFPVPAAAAAAQTGNLQNAQQRSIACKAGSGMGEAVCGHLRCSPGSASVEQHQPHRLLERFAPPHQHVGTLHDNWQAAVARHPEVPALGWRTQQPGGPYSWMTYAEVGDARTALGAGLLQAGIRPGSAIGLYSINCKEWVLLDAAAHAFSMIAVPLYDSLGMDAVQYIVNHADLAAVGCSTTVLPKLLDCLHACPSVRLLIIWDEAPPGPQQQPQHGTFHSETTSYAWQRLSTRVPDSATCQVVTFKELVHLGRAHPCPHVPPRPADIATICYTSGTTGTPKGAVLTHSNLIANAAGCVAAMQPLAWVPGDSHLSFLPLAHIFERKNLTVCVHFGCSVGFYSGDPRAMFADAAVLQPAMFMAVPRVYNRLYDLVMAEVKASNPLQRRLFEAGYAYKAAAVQAGGDLSGGPLASLLDWLVVSRVRSRLGGRVRYMTTGASPISPTVLTFLRVCFGASVVEGYGMTEAACTISVAQPGDVSQGHVGVPLACCEVKLVDLPDMGYLSSDTPFPRGEVCVRGPTVFQGYHNDPQETAAVLDDAGWLHTGDVGEWLPGNRLRLVDRKKHLLKLAQGEYVAPEKLESIYARSPLVQQVFVHGDSLQDRLVAVVVPEPEALLSWAKDRGLTQDIAALCVHPAAVQAVLDSMARQARDAQLLRFEVVAAVWLEVQPFSVQGGLLTPTMKLRRQAARERYSTTIAAMYAKLQQPR